MDDDPIKRAGMIALYAQWIVAYRQWKEQRDIRDAADAKAAQLSKQIKYCKEGMRAFGFDPDNKESLDLAGKTYASAANEVVQRLESPDQLLLIDLQVMPDNLAGKQPENGSVKSDPPAIKDIVVERLKQAGEVGSKAAPIREYIQRTYGVETHEKTVGMTLYRLLKDGRVRRDGHTWFIVPQPAETVNPGASTPGFEAVFDDGKE